jgi:hypothetical protein
LTRCRDQDGERHQQAVYRNWYVNRMRPYIVGRPLRGAGKCE